VILDSKLQKHEKCETQRKSGRIPAVPGKDFENFNVESTFFQRRIKQDF
jgi:hypothetical protein